MHKFNLAALRTVLVLAGVFTTFTGINIACGGIETLGWQGVDNFFAVTNEHSFLVQDSHVRFLGGVWIGAGILFLLAATDMRKYRDALNVVLAMIVLGGLARLTQMHPEVTFGADVFGSFFAELIGIPLLYWWLTRAVASERTPCVVLSRV
jgi:Domain of unknown function (DUF4345)